MARADEVPPGDDPEAEEDLGRRGTKTKEFHLRPVDGKGLKPIPIRDGETKVVGRNARFGILDERIAAHHVECRLVFAPELALELKAIVEVYVKDRFGVLKMLKAGYVGYLQRGSVLYLTRAEGVPICGYVLTEGSPHQAETTPSATGGKGGECIDLASDSDLRSDGEEEIEVRPRPRQAAPSTPQASTSSGSKEEEDAPTPGAKGTAENPCELLSSDDEEEVVVERETAGKKPRKSAAKPAPRASSPPKAARRKPAKPSRSREPPLRPRPQAQPGAGQGARPYYYGAGPQPANFGAGPYSYGAGYSAGFHPGFQPEPSTITPPQPAPAQPGDSPKVAASRFQLRNAWVALRDVQAYYLELVGQLNQAQQQYHVLMAQYGLRPQHELNFSINETTGSIQMLIQRVNGARTSLSTQMARYEGALNTLNSDITLMERDRRNTTQRGQAGAKTTQRGEASANAFQAEVKAWELVEKTVDLSALSAGELRRIAKAMGIDVTGLLEKEEFVNAVVAKRDTGKEAWAARKRKRAAEEEIASRQRQKLAELRQNESRKKAEESAQSPAKATAVRKVKQWAHGADLRLFLQRCGIKVDGHGKTKKALQGAYRRAMLKFHPDRTRSASPADQAIAAEVTKWITSEWNTLRD
jgi:hypothetical protein